MRNKIKCRFDRSTWHRHQPRPPHRTNGITCRRRHNSIGYRIGSIMQLSCYSGNLFGILISFLSIPCWCWRCPIVPCAFSVWPSSAWWSCGWVCAECASQLCPLATNPRTGNHRVSWNRTHICDKQKIVSRMRGQSRHNELTALSLFASLLSRWWNRPLCSHPPGSARWSAQPPSPHQRHREWIPSVPSFVSRQFLVTY